MSEGAVSSTTTIVWTELRDERGKLYARLDVRRLVLEIKRNDRDAVRLFDLRDYVEQLRTFEISVDVE